MSGLASGAFLCVGEKPGPLDSAIDTGELEAREPGIKTLGLRRSLHKWNSPPTSAQHRERDLRSRRGVERIRAASARIDEIGLDGLAPAGSVIFAEISGQFPRKVNGSARHDRWHKKPRFDVVISLCS